MACRCDWGSEPQLGLSPPRWRSGRRIGGSYRRASIIVHGGWPREGRLPCFVARSRGGRADGRTALARGKRKFDGLRSRNSAGTIDRPAAGRTERVPSCDSMALGRVRLPFPQSHQWTDEQLTEPPPGITASADHRRRANIFCVRWHAQQFTGGFTGAQFLAKAGRRSDRSAVPGERHCPQGIHVCRYRCGMRRG